MRQIPNLFLAVAMSVGAPGLVFSQVCPSDCAAPCLSTAPCASYEAPACHGCAPTPTCETRTVSRPFFSWQKIQINTLDRAKDKCSSCPCPQTYCQPQAVMAVPQMTFQPVQVQMTAFQPVMTQAVQSIPVQAVQSIPVQQFQAVQQVPVQAVQSIPVQQFQAVQQIPVQAVQSMPVQQVQMVQQVPTQALQSTATQSQCDCNTILNNIKDLKEQVEELKKKVNGDGTVADLERRVKQREEEDKIQSETLAEIRDYLKAHHKE